MHFWYFYFSVVVLGIGSNIYIHLFVYSIMPIVEVKAYKCAKCGHIWLPRKDWKDELPVVCPKCKSPYWNKEVRE